MNMLNRIFRDQFEYKAGRIRISSGGWVFDPSEALKEKTRKRNPTFTKHGLLTKADATGRTMTLVAQKSVLCPNPNVGQDGIYPRYEDRRDWCVPAYVCRKCEHYKKSDRRGKYRFPRCMWRSTEEPGREALSATLGLLSEAQKTAKEIMGK